MDFFKTLNSEQKKAVTHVDGPLLIVAGAGTGKTTVITQRIAWLIAQGKAKSDEILALTFTDKAAGEMAERVDKLLPLGYLDLWISTFHSFCQRVLSEHALDVGLSNDFILLDQTAQWTLVREHLERFDLDYYRPLGNPTKFIHALLKHFSRAKDEAISPQEYLDYVENLKLNMDSAESTGGRVVRQKSEIRNPKSETNSKSIIQNLKSESDTESGVTEIKRLEEVAHAYHVYQQLLLERNALDFGDLINYTLKLFRERPQILEKYRSQFKYIVVDEFQDTNWAQYELIKLLAAPKNNLTVVADDDQSIYKFRGASVSNLTQFRDDYPKADVISITTNYRSLQGILDVAYAFIQLNNPNRLEATSFHGDLVSKKLIASRAGEPVIEYLLFPDQYAEAEGVVQQIKDLRFKKTGGDGSWDDFAILVRANSQATVFVAALEAAEIPYQYVASRGLYTKRIILDVINFLRLLDDYHESTAMWRTLNWPVFHFSSAVLMEVNLLATRKAWSLYQALTYSVEQKLLPEGMLSEFQKLLALIDTHARMAQERKPREVILSFLEVSGYLKELATQDTAYAHEQLRYLDQFDRRLRDFEASVREPTVKNYLAALLLELDSGDIGALDVDLESGPETVKILTIHSAKGLEFPYVFIAHMVEKRFPSVERREAIELPEALVKERIPVGDIHLEEERRLMYVAMTRARDHLYVTAATDYGGKTKKKPSRFLYELGMVGKEKQIADLRFKIKDSDGMDRSSDHVNMLRGGEALQYRLPEQFSYTQMRAFETCPYQYRFAHILKVPVRANRTLSFGKTMHAALKRFLEMVRERSRNVQGSLFDSDSKEKTAHLLAGAHPVPPLKELLRIYDEEWIDEWYQSAEDKDVFRQQGKRMLVDFHARIDAQPPSVLYLEQGFHLKVTDQESGVCYTVFGVIDRIDTVSLPEGGIGGVEIIDYKTGSAKSETQISRSPELKDQLLLYQIAALEVLGLMPHKLTYYYLDENKPVSFLGTEDEIMKLKKRIVEFAKRVKESDFRAKPAPDKCAYCDYRNICEQRLT